MVGQEWDTKFFPSMKEMDSVSKRAKVGDIIDITMKVNGKYLNPVKMEIADPSSVPASTGTASPTDSKEKTRRRNLGIAVNIMGPKKKSDDAVEYIMDASGVADLIDDYAKETGVFQFNKDQAKDGIPEADDVDSEPESEEVKEVNV